MNSIQSMRKALARSRVIASQQTIEADNLSRNLSKLIRSEMIRNAVTLKRLSEKSKIPMARIVNWLCGSSTHCIPPDVITKLWNAASTSESTNLKKK